MREKLKTIEYNLGLLQKRIEKLRLNESNDYQLLSLVNKMNEKIYEFSDLLETLEVVFEDETL